MPLAVASAETTAELLHIFDLPQLYVKPTATDLLDALACLAIQTPSWDRGDKNGRGVVVGAHKRPQIAPEGVAQYLTSIIASQLRWVEDDEQKEAIWEETSLRLAERSGRTAMPAITRSFVIPCDGSDFELSIYEPSLTGDSLGFKTWAASYLLSKRLHTLELPQSKDRSLRILELGSGTGLVGMAASAVLGARVLLTDLPEIEGNLARNVKQNQEVITKQGGIAQTAILDWSNPSQIIPSASSVSTTGTDTASFTENKIAKFPVIVAADSIYSDEHPAMLVKAIHTWLALGPVSRVIVELPCRDGYDTERQDFRNRMLQSGLGIIEEGEETGYDDWSGSTQDELQEVKCWWSIWSWSARI